MLPSAASPPPAAHNSSVSGGSAFVNLSTCYERRPGTASKKRSTHLSRRRAAPCSLAASGSLHLPQDDMVWRGLCVLHITTSSCLLVTQAVAARLIASLLLEAGFCPACWVGLLVGVRFR